MLPDTQKCRKQLPAPTLHRSLCSQELIPFTLTCFSVAPGAHVLATARQKPTYLWLLMVSGLLALLLELTVSLHSPWAGVTNSATEGGSPRNTQVSIFSHSLVSENAYNRQTSVEVSCQRSLQMQSASFQSWRWEGGWKEKVQRPPIASPHRRQNW